MSPGPVVNAPLAAPSIVIVGAGFSGLGMAIRLLQSGIRDFVMLERATEVGGVWRDNTYPGCACDVESQLYSFSFASNPDWSRVFSGQAEIWAYLRRLAGQFGLYEHLRLGQAFESASWDEDAGLWRIETSGGPMLAAVLISGTGAFSEPSQPELPGLADFKGKVFHSAAWDHDYDLRGRKVAVIGTGASAIQFVPEIQPRVGRLHVFQRTPAWILPRLDRPLSEPERRRYRRYPGLQQLARLRIYLTRELFGLSFRHPRLTRLSEKLARRHLERAIPDPELRARLTPAYTLGCKRVLISNDYYPALAQANVEVVSQAVSGLEAGAILTADGRRREIDTLIFGTGFKVTDYLIAGGICGRSGQSLTQAWQGSPQAHLGTMIHGFPNLFFLLGPNTGLGHSSVILMIEAQIELVLAALLFMRARGLNGIEPQRERQQAYLQELDRRSRGTVWLSGCQSWYLDRTGRNSTLWPASIGAFRRRLLPFEPEDYTFAGSPVLKAGASK